MQILNKQIHLCYCKMVAESILCIQALLQFNFFFLGFGETPEIAETMSAHDALRKMYGLEEKMLPLPFGKKAERLVLQFFNVMYKIVYGLLIFKCCQIFCVWLKKKFSENILNSLLNISIAIVFHLVQHHKFKGGIGSIYLYFIFFLYRENQA